MLDDRKAAILAAVVRDHIETAQPVGSRRIAASHEVGVSSATVRHEMVALEEAGYLAQPHTSAGRIPTDKGYRFFVDLLRSQDIDLASVDQTTVGDFFMGVHGQLESALARTSDMLVALTDWTAVVVAPSADAATVRSVQLVDLASHVAMVVAVLSNGVIEKRTLEVDVELTGDLVSAAAERLSAEVVGKTLGEIADSLDSADASDDDPLMSAALAALSEAARLVELRVGGASRLASAFDGMEQLSEVLALLEEQIVVVSLIRDVLDRGMRVAIGPETGVGPLAECSLVIAPYRADDDTQGTIGVLGPTRMDYSQALSAVAVVSDRLEKALSEG